MGFQLSPGVVTSEIDLTTIVPAVSTTTGAFAGIFNWGPVDQAVQIVNETKLVEFFGKPDSNTAVSFFTCANFLSYANDLRVVRAYGSTTATAVSNANTNSANNINIKNENTYFNNYYSAGIPSGYDGGAWAARYPGAKGNSLKVDYWANTNSALFSCWQYSSLFTGAPGTSTYASNIAPSCNDEIHIVVIDDDGLFTGVKGTVLESYPFLSKASDAKDSQGNSNYYKDVIYRKSRYIYAVDFPVGTSTTWGKTVSVGAAAGGGSFAQSTTTTPVTQVIINGSTYKVVSIGTTTLAQWTTYFDTLTAVPTVGQSIKATAAGTLSGNGSVVLATSTQANQTSLTNGNDGSITTGNLETAYDQFKNGDKIDISLVMTGGHDANVALYAINNIAESRKDCVVFVSPTLTNCQSATPADAIVGYRTDSLSNISSSYAVMDSNWKYQYDKYNDVYRWIPLNGDIAGLCARTDTVRDAWWSPAGLIRGNIKNVVKLAWNPESAEKDTLYKNGINPVISQPGTGTILFGDKTLLSRPSAFDRINVRRLFIVLEKAIAIAAKSSLFEFNDEFTRASFKSMVEPFLRTVKGRRGVYDFRVVCDESNNTPDVVDRNEFVGDIYVKPARSINFIQLNFVAVRSGVSFDEVVGKF